MEIGLDTNYVIDLLNGNIDYKSFQSRFRYIFLPATVLGELFFGAEKSSRKDENYNKIIAFAADCKLIPSDEAVARQYAVCRKKLFNKGTPVPENDIWIAAACIVKGIPIATHDSHFDKIEGLSIIAL